MKDKSSLSIAILVDGDNASPAKLGEAVKLASQYGNTLVKRIYADWTKTGMTKWKDPAKEYSFRLVEALSYIKGKNATDIALTIDAMDLLHTGTVQGFCIVSSDSDYTLLAQRIREAGLLVLGYGESKTPVPFVNSCKKFVYSDKEHEKGDTAVTLLKKEADLFDQAFETVADGKEEVSLSLIGGALKKLKPKFKTSRYGCKTLGAVYEKLDKYELIQTGQKGIYNVVRRKK
jgi:uncharacterized LabA/DUF88 family protein